MSRLIAVDILTVCNSDDVNYQDRVLNRVKNTIAALSNSISLAARQFYRAARSWVVSEGLNTADYAPSIRLGGD